MNEEIIKVAPEVVKTTLPQLANSVYQDLLSPAMKKAGQALGNVIDFATLSFIPLEYVSARIRMNIDKNLKNYQKKLDAVPENEIRNVEPEIGVPIVEKLSYTTCEEIAEMYTSLLAKASTTATVNQAHPSFIQFLERMSVDEARILKYLDKNSFFVCALPQYYKNETEFLEIETDITDLVSKIEMLFPQNINSYIDNLCSIGVILRKTGNYKMNDELYKPLVKIGEQLSNIRKAQGISFTKIEYDKSYYEVTALGRAFIKACLSPVMHK